MDVIGFKSCIGGFIFMACICCLLVILFVVALPPGLLSGMEAISEVHNNKLCISLGNRFDAKNISRPFDFFFSLHLCMHFLFFFSTEGRLVQFYSLRSRRH